MRFGDILVLRQIGSSRSLLPSATLSTKVRSIPIQREHCLIGTTGTETPVGDKLVWAIHYSQGYEFVTTAGNLITLSRISERKARSKTSRGSGSSATSFRRHLELRDDKRCVVTRNKCHSLHLISSQNAWAQMVQKKW